MVEDRVNQEPVTGRPTAERRWADLAARLGSDLLLDLQPDPSAPTRGRAARRRHVLAAALRDAIADGRLLPGTALPPYRSLASDLGLARGTVAAAYQELVAEGWLTARQGSATRVADGASAATPVASPVRDAAESAPSVDHDFSLGRPTAGLFPRSAWIAATRRAVGTAPNSAFGPGHPRGSEPLRRALAGYLARVRGVRTDPEHIVLSTSVLSALELLSRTVLGDRVAVESHGLPFHRAALARGGADVVPIPIDDGGARVDEVAGTDAGAVLVTPSHQYPTGVALDPARRSRVVDWARRTGGLVVEDDYDGEFRYDREPVGALQALGPDVVIYTGSVSKSLSPAVRIAWMVLPPALADTVMWAKGAREPDASVVDQLVLADLIESGAYDRHIRRSRQAYRRRRDRLAERLAADGIEVGGISAGLHAVIPVPPAVEARVVAEAYPRFALAGLSFFRHPAVSAPDRGGIVVGFGSPPDSSYAAAVDALASFVSDRVGGVHLGGDAHQVGDGPRP